MLRTNFVGQTESAIFSIAQDRSARDIAVSLIGDVVVLEDDVFGRGYTLSCLTGNGSVFASTTLPESNRIIGNVVLTS